MIPFSMTQGYIAIHNDLRPFTGAARFEKKKQKKSCRDGDCVKQHFISINHLALDVTITMTVTIQF